MDAKQKHWARIYIGLLAATFFAGAIVRTLKQVTGAEWLEGVVGIILGLAWIIMSLPLLFMKWLTAHRRAVSPILSNIIIGFTFLLGLPVAVGGIFIITRGIQLLSADLR
jgi:hypothetical protein